MVIAWFSCGATSAVACKYALKMFEDVRIVYIETGSAHQDNHRFISDCEKWYHQKIEVIRSTKYTSVLDVLRTKRFINSAYGAPCTFELKKRVRYKFEDKVKNWDAQVFGFDYCKREINRAKLFKEQYPKAKAVFPLIENKISKPDALGILRKANIKIPEMYRLGFSNNNCIGCVKGGINYWARIKKLFPEEFNEMCRIERTLNHTCIRKNGEEFYLDMLKESDETNTIEILPECSIYCEIEFLNLQEK